tara:strand:+ start:192 stop:467 length:276 start_codon:yes stop_codon:yes gene_type:complete
MVLGLFRVRSALLIFLIAWILRISFIAFLIVVALCLIIGLEGSNSVILRYAPNTSNVGINLFDLIVLLIAFIVICSQFALNSFRYFFVTIL